MKRTLAVAAGLLLSASAYAAPIMVDDFNTLQTTVDTTAGNGSVSTTQSYTIDGNAFTRTLIVDQIEHTNADPSLQSKGDIGFGTFKLSNASETNSLIELRYDVDSLVASVSDTSKLMLDVLFTDASEGQPFTIAGYLNGAFLGSQTYTGPGSLSFNLPELAASGNELRLAFSGGTAFDATLGPISLQISEGGGGLPVPEPGAIGLLGLGLAGLALSRRRKAAA